MNKKEERIEKIRQSWLRFEYGLGQADHDVRFLLTQLTGKDPNHIKERQELDLHKYENPDCGGFKDEGK